jgi:hypothetical protein
MMLEQYDLVSAFIFKYLVSIYFLETELSKAS